jgi:hypothetical protein
MRRSHVPEPSTSVPILAAHTWRALLTSGPVLALVSGIITVLVLELGFRLADFDFEFKAHAFNTVPIFYRQPIVPVGESFFRRPGPDRWEGNALDVMYRMTGGNDGAYRELAPVTVTYDALGFRNPETLRDWDLVVVGDSFTELGFLSYEDLFTTRLGRELGLRVKNLGVSYTGTSTQAFYLREYGKAASTTDSILIFFEGNDFKDLVNEHRRLETARASGAPPNPPRDAPTRLAALPKQTSFVVAVQRWLTGYRPTLPVGSHPFIGNAGEFNAYFVGSATRTPVTIERQMPPSAIDLPPLERALVSAAIAAYGDTARQLGLRPWLAFMPCKRRALDGQLVWKASELARPLPLGMPDLVRELAIANDIRFVDLTPALQRESAAGRLTYNAMWDTHLNQLGSLTVARVLAEALASRGEEPRHR